MNQSVYEKIETVTKHLENILHIFHGLTYYLNYDLIIFDYT